MMLRIAIFLSALLMAWPAFADTGIRVVVPNRDIARGETIAESDLVYGTIASNNVFSGIATSVDMLKGMEARRALRAGEVVRTDDVRHPVVVAKGSIVTMTFEAPGVMLTASGRAMGEGGVGDTITVQNPASFRQISCVVTGPGAVRAASSALIVSPPTTLARAH
ncbi:MAG TPA: flagellar basal body P-ring formation chaperone FlgA [Rhizomicrobium sp.]|jgi:flagella basal body P-ring formation protein FlgA|nr:flagellar basal body P-ring formation chaperone FlgA [Rhizomicrobium sp.]